MQPSCDGKIVLLVCLLFGFQGWNRAARGQSALATDEPATVSVDVAFQEGKPANSPSVDPNSPVITISGLCDSRRGQKVTDSSCATVITRGEFEKVIDAVQPNMPDRARHAFALTYANALVMSKMAEDIGLDEGLRFREQIRVARIEILSKELTKVIQEKVSQVSNSDIDDYYDKHLPSFERAEVDRIYVPKARQSLSTPDRSLGDGDTEARSGEAESIVRDEAEKLHSRALSGEPFENLQGDAYRFARVNVRVGGYVSGIKVRRASLPSNQTSVMDLKPGEVSAVLVDPGGFVIYKLETKEILPLEQVREEIRATLRAERLQNEMRGIEEAATPSLDESYFRLKRPLQTVRPADEPGKPTPRL